MAVLAAPISLALQTSTTVQWQGLASSLGGVTMANYTGFFQLSIIGLPRQLLIKWSSLPIRMLCTKIICKAKQVHLQELIVEA